MTVNNLTGSDFLLNSRRKTSSKLQKSLEKLSSGYQINRAADDAAHLAISEKARAVIAGLDQGTKNINDGISYLHSQDGSSQEIHNIIHRLEELAVQAANGTYDDLDRDALDCEYQQLIDEIGHITDTSNFNGIPLFEKHMQAYGLSEGVVTHNKPVEINDTNMPLVIGYSVDGVHKEYSINVPHGTYEAEE
ncbi:MAG: flagellin, partial [Oscillospiraceae bacterium]